MPFSAPMHAPARRDSLSSAGSNDSDTNPGIPMGIEHLVPGQSHDRYVRVSDEIAVTALLPAPHHPRAHPVGTRRGPSVVCSVASRRYTRMLQDPRFLFSTVRVCQLCHIKFTQKKGTKAADLGLIDMVRPDTAW